MANPPLVPPNWQLPIPLRNRLGSSVGRQRLLQADSHLLIVAHEAPGPDEMTRKGVLFWRDAEGTWRCSNGDPGKAGIDILLNRYETRIREFDRDESSAQDANDYLRILEALAPLTRAARHLAKVLGEARDACTETNELVDLCDRAYDISRTADLAYQYTRDDMDVAVIRRAERHTETSELLARATHRLNLMAAFFLPLATISSVFGTTLTDNWSWARTSAPFLLMLVVGLLAGIVLTAIIGQFKIAANKLD